MRAKPILTYSLLAGALALPGPAHRARARQADGRVRRSASRWSAQIELLVGDAGGARLAVGARSPIRRSTGRTTSPTRACCRARASRSSAARRHAVPRSRRRAPVNEPYLDLLVEVNWASGRVVRDYTFLLDPPGMRDAGAGRAGHAGARRAPRRAARPRRAAAAPRRRRGAAPRRAAAATRTRCKRGDTLSRIAERVQARDGHARADAGRAVQRATRARSTATT